MEHLGRYGYCSYSKYDRIIIEIPFPTPFAVICSPNHISIAVPATKIFAPASLTLCAVFKLIPPSTSMSISILMETLDGIVIKVKLRLTMMKMIKRIT